MDDPATFGPVPDGATVLTELDGWQYLAVAWVHRRQSAGQLEYYATVERWQETPAAQLARRDEEIRHLQARIADLERQVDLALREMYIERAHIQLPRPVLVFPLRARYAGGRERQWGSRLKTTTGRGVHGGPAGLIHR